MVIVLRHKLGNTYEHLLLTFTSFMYRWVGWFVACVSVRICRYHVLSGGNFYVTRVGWINCFIVIYCVFLFYMLIVLRHTGSRFKYFLYELFMLIYFAGIARRVIWSEYTYIYCTCAGCIIVIVCIFVSLCSAPSTVLPLSREPNLGRSVVIIGGARPQL